MKKRFKIISIFLLLSAFGNTNAQNYDLQILQSINSQNTRYDKIWRGITQSTIPVSLATPIALYGLDYFHYLPNGKKNSYAAIGGLAINSIVTIGLKYLIKRERPFVTERDVYQKTYAGSYSFPSGHTSLAFVTATNLSLAYPKWYVAVPAYLWAGSVGYSRMHLGVHYPSDVLVGALVGTLSGFLAFKVNQKISK